MRKYIELLKRWLIPGGGVAERTVKSGIWYGLINVSDRFFQLLMVLVVARVVGPDAIGLIGIALLVLAGLNRFSRLGFNEALVQNVEENVDEYLSTALYMQIARGVAIAAIAYFAAPWVGVFFDEPRAVDLLRVLAIAPILQGFMNPGIMYFEKDLQFHKQFVYLLSGRISSFVVTVGYALVYQSVWALVFGQIAGQVVRLVISYRLHEYRPTLEFELEFAREMFDYGKWILGSEMLSYVFDHGDDAFVGWYLSATALGFYQIAYQISNAPATEIAQVISHVMFPAYSKVQTNIRALRQGFFDTMQLTVFLSLPAGVGIIVVAPTFVEAFLGDDWLPMIVPMQLITIYGIMTALQSPTTPLFKATGRPDLRTKIQALKLVLIVITIYPATARYGLVGTGLAVASISFISTPIVDYLAVNMVEGSFRELFRIMVYPSLGSAVMGVGVVLIRENVRIGFAMAEFAVLVLSGVLLYSLVMIAVEWQFDYGIEPIFRSIREAVG